MAPPNMLEKILSREPLPGMADRNDQNDSFRDYLYRSVRRKEDILEMMLREGGLEALHDFMHTDPLSCDKEYFDAMHKKSSLVLRAIDGLSISLPTTNYSQIQTEITHKKSDAQIAPPRHISKEELMKANMLYLEGKQEEKAFKTQVQEKNAKLDQVIDITVPAEAKR